MSFALLAVVSVVAADGLVLLFYYLLRRWLCHRRLLLLAGNVRTSPRVQPYDEKRNLLLKGWCVPGVGGTAAVGCDGAKLHRAVGSNWRSTAATGRPGDRIRDRLLSNFLDTTAQYHR
jgi:hypothetical protein